MLPKGGAVSLQNALIDFSSGVNKLKVEEIYLYVKMFWNKVNILAVRS